MGPRNRNKGGICAEERKDVPIIKGGKRRGEGVYSKTVEEGIYLTVKVTINSTSIFCREKGWEEENGPGL